MRSACAPATPTLAINGYRTSTPESTHSPFDLLRGGRLQWLPELELGYYEVEAGSPYNQTYFDKYRAMAGTAMGVAITAARAAMVRRWWQGMSVDVGIGCGQFVESTGCLGYDVNPAGVAWLRQRGAYLDPYEGCDAVTCWDSLEHMRDPGALLANVRRWVFVSLPIFRDAEHAAGSRHFRRDEHYWYFTARGLERFMSQRGFVLRENDNIETLLGREDIGSFAFERAVTTTNRSAA